VFLHLAMNKIRRKHVREGLPFSAMKREGGENEEQNPREKEEHSYLECVERE